MEMHNAENGHGIHMVLSFQSSNVTYCHYTNEVSKPCSCTCSWRALIAEVVHSDDSLWEVVRGKPWFQNGGEHYENHYNQLAERSF